MKDQAKIVGGLGTEWKLAQEMRVLLCALITAHKLQDSNAFWATVEISKNHLSRYAEFDEKDWAIFRRDGMPAQALQAAFADRVEPVRGEL